MFRKVLIANRGEIACRVIETCRRLGVATVAVYSDADASALHVSLADEAVRLGPAPAKQSYLHQPALLQAIVKTGADAVHPGYGLLSENPAFAEGVAGAGATFIGPRPGALELFGDKIAARALASRVGLRPPPGSDNPVPVDDPDTLQRAAARVGFPVLVKAASGGGGIGMQVVEDGSRLQQAARSASDRARMAFGDGRVYVERYLERPRHIEIQVARDGQGGVLAFGERECSVQRRHQKVVEESPSPASFLREPGRRAELCDAALRLVDAADYEGVGTVELVADASGEVFFLEVNARLQVEHPVTEAIHGVDLVELQLRVASGEALPSAATQPSGHAVEARIYAEDPQKKFAPQPGTLSRVEWPRQDGVRVDAGVVAGYVVTVHYDPLLAKVIAHAADRTAAIDRLDAALAATVLELQGPKGPRVTNVALLRQILANDRFRAGDYDTGLIGEMMSRKA